MPNRKLFEAFDINAMFNGGNTTKMLSMKEISEIYFEHIQTTYKYLDEGKAVSIEVPSQDRLYRVKKMDNGNFVLDDNNIQPIELVNLLFSIAPFISFVGYEN